MRNSIDIGSFSNATGCFLSEWKIENKLRINIVRNSKSGKVENETLMGKP